MKVIKESSLTLANPYDAAKEALARYEWPGPTKPQLTLVVDIETKWSKAAPIMDLLNPEEAKKVWLSQHKATTDAVVAGTPIPRPENFWGLLDVQSDFVHQRDSLRSGLETLCTMATPTNTAILQSARDFLNDKAIDLDEKEKRQSKQWRLEHKSSLELDRLHAIVAHLDRRVKDSTPNWCRPPSKALEGVVSFTKGGK